MMERGLRDKECWQVLETGKGKDTDSALEHPEGIQLYLHHHFSMARLISSKLHDQ